MMRIKRTRTLGRFYVNADESDNSLNFPLISRVIVDSKTGVQYLYVQSGFSGGVTVLVDKDGKPLIDSDFAAIGQAEKSDPSATKGGENHG